MSNKQPADNFVATKDAPLPLGPEHRLVVYGTLAPGRSNANQLSNLNGTWTKGTVRGHLKAEGWGALEGYPGLTPDPNGTAVEVLIFESQDLPNHWDRLDAFEGHDYQRVMIEARLESGELQRAMIYAVGQLN